MNNRHLLDRARSAAVFAGVSTAAERLRLQVARIAPHYRMALITGEHGSGKTAVAWAMHEKSPVAADTLAILSATDFASGTALPAASALYLRNVEQLAPELQTAMVARLRVAGRQARVMLASETDLRGMVAAGRMSSKTLAAFSDLEIRVAPLRERPEDLPAIAAVALEAFGSAATLGEVGLAHLRAHAWPGNLAEFWQTLEQASGCDGELLPAQLPFTTPLPAVERVTRLDTVIERHVVDVLERCAGNKLRAAELLGISRSTLYRMLGNAAN